MQDFNKILKEKLNFCILSKNSNPRSSTIALSSTGKNYLGFKVESFNHLLNISSENAALLLAIQNNDFGVNKLITMAEDKNHVDPLILKIIADHSIRTGNKITFKVIDVFSNNVFNSEESLSELKFYKPNTKQLQKTLDFNLESNKTRTNKDKIKEILKEFAIKGINKNFPNYDTASGYGTAVITSNNNLYFSGQYSSPDNRLGIHSEMGAVLSAIMNDDPNIEYIGVVSTKFKNNICSICGSCRQFLVEHSSRTKTQIKIFSFALENEDYEEYLLNDYLPDSYILD